MKKFSLLIILLCVCTSSKSQVFCLKSSTTGSSIDYAHISFLDSNKGTYSDENGCFNVKEEIDSVLISHISFEDTILVMRELPSIIYLNTKENQLTNIVISAKRKGYSKKKKLLLPKNKENNYLNIPSFEIGRALKKTGNDKWIFINKIYFPLKIGKDIPLLKVNLYTFNTDTNRPDSLIWSDVMKDKNYKKNIAILDDLSIDISNYNDLFVSIELIGYIQNDKNIFTPYSNSKNALRIYMIKGNKNKTYIRNKNIERKWFPMSESSIHLLNKEPIIQVEIE